MQRNIWPGLTLAGGVLVAAVAALLLIGGSGGGPPGGRLPVTSPPGVTRIFPAKGAVAGETAKAHHHKRVAGAAPSGSAAVTQYAAGNRGTVLGAP